MSEGIGPVRITASDAEVFLGRWFAVSPSRLMLKPVLVLAICTLGGTALRGALRSKRVPHALLFTGPRGVGKFTLARMFAQAANCERLADDFCGECAACTAPECGECAE